MPKSYLITKHGQITKWVARQPLSIDEAALQKLFPNLPSGENERERFFIENQDLLGRLFEAVASYFDEGDSLECHEDPKGKALTEWNKAEVKLDNGEDYRYIFQPVSIDLDLLQEVAETKDYDLPPEFSERLKSS